MKMKILPFILMLFISLNLKAQDKINVAIGSFGYFIETYNYIDFNDHYEIDMVYRIGPTSGKTLKEGISTAQKWVNLNLEHNQTFSKEICRFIATEKSVYDFHGYVKEFSNDIIVTFYGFPNGVFKLKIEVYDGHMLHDFIIIENVDMLKQFQQLLNGKSANDKIDDIFKK